VRRWAHIRVTEELKRELDALKRDPREPYHSVIKRLVNAYRQLQGLCARP
jgi:hypothetical protein